MHTLTPHSHALDHSSKLNLQDTKETSLFNLNLLITIFNNNPGEGHLEDIVIEKLDAEIEELLKSSLLFFETKLQSPFNSPGGIPPNSFHEESHVFLQKLTTKILRAPPTI